MRERLEYDIPVYKSKRYRYIRICDLKEHDRPQLERWIFGHFQPLIQGEKGATIDELFFEDYERYLRGEKLPLTFEEVLAIMQSLG